MITKSVVLYTSGVDSYILLNYVRTVLKQNVQPVYFDLGHRYAEVEKHYITSTEPDCIIDTSLDLAKIERRDAFIPNRNILLATMAVSKYRDTVWIGGSKSDRVNDNNEKVFEKLSKLLTMTNKKHVVKIDSPFWACYKENMVEWYVSNNGGFCAVEDLLKNTFSCFYPVEKRNIPIHMPQMGAVEYYTEHCMQCVACLRRNAVLLFVDVLIPFYNNKIAYSYFDQFSREVCKTLRGEITIKYIQLLMDKRIIPRRRG